MPPIARDATCSEHEALARLLFAAACRERGAGGVLEHLAHALAGLGGALDVVLRADALCDGGALDTANDERRATGSE